MHRQRTRFDHNKALAAIQRQILGPAGLSQVGRSRSWLDDHAWWLLSLWFEPSGFERGTYLRAGRMYLWNERGRLAFDEAVTDRWTIAGRLVSFVRATDPIDWERDMRDLCRAAVRFVDDVRAQPQDLHAAVQRLKHQPGSAFQAFNLAVAEGLRGRPDEARTWFDRVVTEPDHRPFMAALAKRSVELSSLLVDIPAFRREIAAVIAMTRRSLGLPGIENDRLVPR